jgi:hypothetical protein
VYPDSAIAAGWLLTAFAMVQVPIFGSIALCKSRKRLADAFRYIQDKKKLNTTFALQNGQILCVLNFKVFSRGCLIFFTRMIFQA